MSRSDFIDKQCHYSAANADANLIVERTEDGQKVSLTLEFLLPYEDGQCVVLPQCCSKCPFGFQKEGCGRAIPFNMDSYIKRPAECYLEQVTIEEILRKSLGLDVKGVCNI
ncbi:MAG: hypothetical protein J6A25_07315 [Lachnospiraceae bacterium]|nr:hypothetical protein [Lachnospiraceae bacterium]